MLEQRRYAVGVNGSLPVPTLREEGFRSTLDLSARFEGASVTKNVRQIGLFTNSK